jgi:hypothetical protein
MPDYNPSVALGINSQEPNQGLKTLSSIMGLGQQGLAIRGQQSQNQSLAAKATVDTQSAAENQNLAKLMADPVGNGIVDADGNPTKAAQQKIMAAAPTTGSQHYSDFVNAASNKVKFNGALNELRTSERQEVLQNYAGAASSADSPEDVKAVGAALLASKKGTPEEGNYQDIVNGLNGQMDLAEKHQKATGKVAVPGQELWRGAVLTATRAGLPSSATVGPGGLATPEQATTGAGNVNRSRISGALSQPPGAATGSAINPTPVQVAGATTTATGQAAGDNERNTQISNSVAPSRQAIVLTQQMDKYADMVRTGKYSQEIANAQAALGVNTPEAAARQLMGKTAAQLKTIAIANAPSDTARDTINAGFPDPDKMNPDAIRGADEMIRGNMKMNLARAANAQRFQSTHGGTQGLRSADDQLTGTADGLMYEYQGLKPGPERQEFLQRHFKSRDEANDWVSRKNLVEHNGGFQQ